MIGIRIGIVACEVLKHEIEMLTAGDPDIVHREYLEFALHVYPDDMRRTIIEKVGALEGRVDAVLIGYATCSSLKDLPEAVKVPSVMLEGDDCVAVLIGQEEYAREKRTCAGTWFSSPGWAEQGLNGVIKALRLDSMEAEGYDGMYFMRMMFEGYSRCLYVDTGVCPAGCEEMSRDFAGMLGLRHDRRAGDLSRLSESVQRTKRLAAEAAGGERAQAAKSPLSSNVPS